MIGLRAAGFAGCILITSVASAAPGDLLRFVGRDCTILMSKTWPEARPGYLLATDVVADVSASADLNQWVAQGLVGNITWRTFRRTPSTQGPAKASDVGVLVLTDQALLVPQLSNESQVLFMSRNSPENPNRTSNIRVGAWMRVTVTRTTPGPANGNADAVVEVISTHARPGPGGVFVPDQVKSFSFRCAKK